MRGTHNPILRKLRKRLMGTHAFLKRRTDEEGKLKHYCSASQFDDLRRGCLGAIQELDEFDEELKPKRKVRAR